MHWNFLWVQISAMPHMLVDFNDLFVTKEKDIWILGIDIHEQDGLGYVLNWDVWAEELWSLRGSFLYVNDLMTQWRRNMRYCLLRFTVSKMIEFCDRWLKILWFLCMKTPTSSQKLVGFGFGLDHQHHHHLVFFLYWRQGSASQLRKELKPLKFFLKNCPSLK